MYIVTCPSRNHASFICREKELRPALNRAYSEAKRNHDCVSVVHAWLGHTVARFDYRQVSWFSHGKFYSKDLSSIK